METTYHSAMLEWRQQGEEPADKPKKLEGSSVEVLALRKTWFVYDIKEVTRLCNINHNIQSGSVVWERGFVTIVDLNK
jgi:hypothetical protein